MKTRRVALIIGVTVLMYTASWLVWYISILGTDFSYVFEYFYLAWTKGGFEYPAFIQLGALATTVLGWVLILLFIYIRKRLNW